MAVTGTWRGYNWHVAGVAGRGAANYDWHQRHVHPGHEPTSPRGRSNSRYL